MSDKEKIIEMTIDELTEFVDNMPDNLIVQVEISDEESEEGGE